MGIIARIKGWFDMLFKSKAKEEFNIEDITSDEMKRMIDMCANIYRGKPYWVDADEHIKTINFAKAVCSETARLATIQLKIDIDGGARAEWIQNQINAVMFKIREWVEYGCAYGTVVIKPNGESIDMYKPDEFIVTDARNGEIIGIVFLNHDVDESGKKFYTRLEYHHMLPNRQYQIKNVCYVGTSKNDMNKKVPIDETPWAGMWEDTIGDNIDRPLYGVLRMPNANNIDVDSPMSLPVFSDAIEELKDLDVAYSRNSKEIRDSKRLVLLDSDRLLPTGGKVHNTIIGFTKAREDLGLPDYVKNVYGDGQENFYQEINPTLNTDTRLTGINSLLSQIGYKVGFSNGYFVFNEKTGFATATQVESEQSRTIQFIEDIRNRIKACLYDVIYAVNAFGDDMLDSRVYPREEFLETINTDEDERKIHIHFGPIYSNFAEDRQRAYQLTLGNFYPKEYYLHMFEGLSVEESKKLVEAAQPKEPTLFGGEE